MNNFIFHLSKASPKLKLHGTYRARNVVKKRSQETREKAMYLSTGFMGCNFQAAVSLMNYLTDTANFKKVQDNFFELSETFTPNRSIFWKKKSCREMYKFPMYFFLQPLTQENLSELSETFTSNKSMSW